VQAVVPVRGPTPGEIAEISLRGSVDDAVDLLRGLMQVIRIDAYVLLLPFSPIYLCRSGNV
jgi:hypothetical protein